MHFYAPFIFVSLVFFCAPPTLGEEISTFLTHMPQNSDKRCVGIAGVAEALLEGEQAAEHKTSIDELAREIYQSFTSDKPVRFPSHLELNGKLAPIDEAIVLESLSTRVAELYKADYFRLSDMPAGIDRLSAAQQNVVRTRDELIELLQADPDKIVFFCCFGKRIFPSGKVSETSHAVLIQPMPHDELIVYDPNDPGRPAVCTLKETGEGLQVIWTCKYRDQEIETTQYYLVVPQSKYFRALQ